MPKKALTGFELTHDLGNMIYFLFFMTQFLLPCQKITISTHNGKKEKKILKKCLLDCQQNIEYIIFSCKSVKSVVFIEE